MACDSFIDCVNDPLIENELDAADTFVDLSSTAIYSINLALWLFQISLIVAVSYFIFKSIYSIIGADSSEAYEKFQGAILNAVFAAVGLILIGGSRFIFVAVLGLLGISYDENAFGGGLNAIFGI